MKKTAFFLLWTLLSVSAFAQQAGKYSTDVQVVSVSSVKNTVTLRCSGLGDNKKEALVMAQKSALYTLLHVGVKGVNNGQPLWAIVDEDYDRRMFEEDRYATVVANCQDLGKYTKENGRVRAEVEATFYLQPLMKAAGVVGANVGTVARTNLPSITIVPFVRQDENQMEVLEGNSMNRVAASSVEMMFSKRGYLTKNYKTMIQNLQNNDILLQGSQSEAVEKMLQNAGTCESPGEVQPVCGKHWNCHRDGGDDGCGGFHEHDIGQHKTDWTEPWRLVVGAGADDQCQGQSAAAQFVLPAVAECFQCHCHQWFGGGTKSGH